MGNITRVSDAVKRADALKMADVAKRVQETSKNTENTQEHVPYECTVKMDSEVVTTNDFVCVFCKKNGDVSICYNTDALTLGMAFRMVGTAFLRAMSTLSPEEQKQIMDIVQPADVAFKQQ